MEPCEEQTEGSNVTQREGPLIVLPGDPLPSSFLYETRLRVTAKLKDGVLWSQCGGAIVTNPYIRWRKALFSLGHIYTPLEGDYVIGIVSQKSADVMMVNINASFEASLSTVEAFEGATKQFRPNLQVGSIVYCIVDRAHKDYETELTCKCVDDPKHWNTKETYFGELQNGFVFTVPLVVANSLMGDRCFLLERLGRSLRFEIAIGVNGRVWIHSTKPLDTIIVMNAITYSLGLTLPQMEALCQKLLNE
ncbi:putative exosomal 3'-5' exoribonuclease complex subunit [Cardiosporidium cionae]|uniref:Exosomal 3'-5' exoribonuclease complex subunit n=1 Tax=Cardiosporidium cionae TaxID=476202 RepID=A0ABQ7JBS7_9APIC|nr:putative exosomal 3'-5' exoribonuclease complex subunit [Cardiosporidium cionae]|eukprot:KAF8821125.1 putative exosomal 3'-5' exoribonuclease complex subunit [Cardiosporidium cionae]